MYTLISDTQEKSLIESSISGSRRESSIPGSRVESSIPGSVYEPAGPTTLEPEPRILPMDAQVKVTVNKMILVPSKLKNFGGLLVIDIRCFLT